MSFSRSCSGISFSTYRHTTRQRPLSLSFSPGVGLIFPAVCLPPSASWSSSFDRLPVRPRVATIRLKILQRKLTDGRKDVCHRAHALPPVVSFACLNFCMLCFALTVTGVTAAASFTSDVHQLQNKATFSSWRFACVPRKK